MVAAVVAVLIGFGPRGFLADSPIQAFAVSPDGRRVACARDGNWFDVFDPSGNHVASGRASDPDQIRVLAFSPDGKTLAGGNGGSETVWLWDAATGEQGLPVTANSNGVWSLAFSPDGKLLACGGSDDGTVRVIDPATRATVFALGGPTGEGKIVKAIAFHPTGRFLVACTSNSGFGDRAKLCRTGDRPRVVRTFGKPNHGLDLTNGPVAFHPSGRTVFVSTGRGLRAVETVTGERRWEAAVGKSIVEQLAADPTGRFVAGRLDNNQLRIWDAHTGELVSVWRPHGSSSIAGLATGGDRLFTAGENRAVRAWPWPPTPPGIHVRPTAADPATLAGQDAAAAFAAVRRLASDPASVALARVNLTPVPPPSADTARRVRSLVRQLGLDDFDARQAASRDLAAQGSAVAPELRRALRAADDPEVTARLAELLRDFERTDDVTAARWLEVLERIGSPEAIAVVRAVAGGDPDHPRTEDAADTLARMTGSGMTNDQ